MNENSEIIFKTSDPHEEVWRAPLVHVNEVGDVVGSWMPRKDEHIFKTADGLFRAYVVNDVIYNYDDNCIEIYIQVV